MTGNLIKIEMGEQTTSGPVFHGGRNIDIRQIQYFLTVAEHLHFRKAAEALGVTQPALSLRIQALEEDIGVQLLHRNRHTTKLTYAGEIFRQDLSDVLAASEQATERVRRAATGNFNSLRVGFISTATTSYFLSQLIKEFRRTYPHIELTLQNFPNISQLGMIEKGGLDIGFLRLPIATSDQIELVPIHKEPHVLLIPESSPLARQKIIRPADLQNTPFIMYARKNAAGYHDLIMRSLNKNGINPIIIQEVSEMYTLVSLVSAGIGAAIAPISTLNYKLPRIIQHEVSWLPAAEIAMAFRSDALQPETRLFIDLARRS